MTTLGVSLGFAFDDLGRVALIQKNRPAWQAGHWNGIGGKEEPRDGTVYGCMEREFFEETGVYIPAIDWTLVGIMTGKVGWKVHIFKTVSPAVREVRTMTDERVDLFTERTARQLDLIDNLPLFFELCKLKPSPPSNSVPMLELTYGQN